MFFTSGTFWIFFLIAAVVYYLFPRKIRWTVLLAASLYFYGSWKIGFLILLLGQIVWIYVLVRWMENLPRGGLRRLIAWIAAVGPLLTLIVFKYARMITESLAEVFKALGSGSAPGVWKLVVPVGISFYTFKVISYVIEVYRGRIPAEKNPGLLALYVSFFPQILAGPIDRPNRLLPQLRAPRNLNADDIVFGVRRIAWGIFKKLVVADRLAYYVGFVFDSPAHQGLNLIFAAYLYAIQIYCDFSGYSDIAIGLAKILGIDSAENFDRPYLSRSMSQFWAKWHITLSSWLRDYLFLPISYGLMRRMKGDKFWGIRVETWGYSVGIMITMTLCGLWHGAAWTFVVWGALHGFYLVVSVVTRKLRKRLVRATGLKKRSRLHEVLAVIVTFNLVSFAWIFFRAASLQKAVHYISYLKFKYYAPGFAHLVFDAALLLLFLGLNAIYWKGPEWPWMRKVPLPLKLAGYALFVCLMILLAVNSANEFLYVKF